ncbi:penicillin-binding protein [Candidatus Campbellbacteria bacterium CG22_combo_CG10-13_8_21_14_all_36_13]|uniref:Penicillin-binding protein n=1 Tax=Candidatus Campbellbacteria bacterium CG22_combo_CG10-13_8_21_14_all_36_13 TaxID=1974529 RepID=A0A2H0E0G6_9BACT|nr:MAG: penicillin-binding protein [Candidatus Campbellbacteria bacterium CG22_combo_CG10-13_8_21_14_all_36_13]
MAKNQKKSKLLLVFKFLLVIGVFFAGVVVFWLSSFDIPDLTSFEERKVVQSTKIYDKTGEVLLYEFNSNDIKRTVVSGDQISRYIKNATIAVEDADFYQHIGIRPLATIRAVFLQPLKGKGVQGGSTITQQVIKNSLLTSEKKISRKLKEWILALRIEQVLTKDQILELYLNETPYGGSIYGVGEASETFFGVSSSDVTLAQAAYLAALPQAPTYYSPYGNNKEDLNNRKNFVLSRMFENRFITKEEYDDAISEAVDFIPRATLGIRAPHFVFFIGEYLEQKYGPRVLEEGGLRIITTLDYSLQEKAEKIVREYALQNAESFNAENASLVAIDPKTGGILVMVGSRDYFDEKIDGNFNVAVSHRQPGSSFKPFVYATAFMKGYTPETVVFDLKTQFSTQCSPSGVKLTASAVCYTPVNYDGIYRGPITFREALAQSINIPAIKALYLAGLNDSLRTAKDMGISSLTNVDQYGLTLVLGGGEVSLLEMASAYGVFANDGVRNQYNSISRIEDSSGVVIETTKTQPKQAIPVNVARTISDILSDNTARTPAFGSNSPLYFASRDVAVKTGTTNDYKDAWTVGYTPNIAVAAWAGNNNNTSMEKKVAGFIITPLWRAFMNEALAVLPDERFKNPDSIDKTKLPPMLRGVWQGGKSYFIDSLSGKLATELTPKETLKEIVLLDPHTILYWVNKDNPVSDEAVNPENYSQYHLWEYAVQNWVNKMGYTKQDESLVPKEYDDIHIENNLPKISIVGLQNKYTQDSQISFSINSNGVYPINNIEIFFAGRYVGSITKPPFNYSFSIKDFSTQQNNELKVVATDIVYNKKEVVENISVQ